MLRSLKPTEAAELALGIYNINSDNERDLQIFLGGRFSRGQQVGNGC